jgi:WD40 repeat protein
MSSPLSSAVTGKRKRSAAQDEDGGKGWGALGERQVVEISSLIYDEKINDEISASPSASHSHVAVWRVLEHFTGDDLASVLPMMYQTCRSWRDELEHPHWDHQKRTGVHMKTFSLCRALAHGKGEMWLPDQDDDRAWWLDACSLVQRYRSFVGSGTVWSWLQAASQEPDAGPLSLSRRASSTARAFRKGVVCLVRTRYFGQECKLTGHSDWVLSVAYSPDGKHIVTGSRDNTVKVWDSQTGKEVRVLVCHRPIVCCCVH